MKRTVTVTIQMDPEEYEGIEDTPKGCIQLTLAMLAGDADLPQDATVTCEGMTSSLEEYDENNEDFRY